MNSSRLLGLALLVAAWAGATACNDTHLLAAGAPTDTATPLVSPTPSPEPSGSPTPASAIGCADGTREGFLSLVQYPDIAACAGAWSVPGVSQSNLAPTCDHQSGNTSSNADGAGCSAADLCATGWHVCHGFSEVAAHSPGGCTDAVPASSGAGAFFAIAQHSHSNMICDDSSPDTNDVFGCGTMGASVSASQHCGPLNVALASEQSASCGWNQAMPPIGPWQCTGSDSYNEGAFVTKNGCTGNSCSYSGTPVGNSDDGGVLCCRD